MALPHSRFYTHVAGNVLGGSPFDVIQDLAVAFFVKGRRKRQSLHLPVWGARGGTWWTHTTGNGYVSAPTVGSLHVIPLHLPPGRLLAQAFVGYYRAGATGITWRLRRQSHAQGAAATVDTTTLSSGPTAWFYEALTFSGGGHKIAAGYSYWLELVAGQGGDRTDRCEVVYTGP